MNFDLQLKSRRALVTGGTRGVGKAIVETLGGAGARIIATGRSHPIQPAEGVHYVAADLSTEDGCAAVANAVMAQFGGVDIIVNVVGGSSAPAGGFAALDDTIWWQELNQNLMPAVRLDRAWLPSMIEQGSGVIIHVTSIQRTIAGVDNRLCRGKGGAFDL
jgi:NAD(P)-dependent dehydrogenase (short-subunit alcohol dehydrogenase family)